MEDIVELALEFLSLIWDSIKTNRETKKNVKRLEAICKFCWFQQRV